MTATPEPLSRRDTLTQDLNGEIKRYSRYAKVNYVGAYGTRILIIASSLAAGIGGLFLQNEKLFALFAFVPAAVAIITSTLKLQDRANWHFRKKEGLQALRYELLYELPDPFGCKDVAAVSRKVSVFNLKMTKEWERMLAPEIPKANPPGEDPPRP